ncbi:MAG: group I intron-associated PD-(D/E)XK endonuclease [Gaiellaceae bacterium]
MQCAATPVERAQACFAAQVVQLGHGPADCTGSVGGMLTTDQKGAVAKLAIAKAAADLGIGVWAPFTVERYDLIFDLRPRLIRVQCKWRAVMTMSSSCAAPATDGIATGYCGSSTRQRKSMPTRRIAPISSGAT